MGWDDAAPAWILRATGIVVPPREMLPTGVIVAVGRIWEDEGLDCIAAKADRWWWPDGSEARGTIPWHIEECVAVEPLPAGEGRHLAALDPELLPELRSRYALARDGIWRPEPAEVPHAIELVGPPPAPPVTEPPPEPVARVYDDTPIPPMAEHPEQLGLFGETTGGPPE
ncbi:hypothetical protein DRW03_21195 [Corallococcus sp. H22C18031201]|nr:hypothetical protein DRW03_21195 [Corallococcus sp. H22C18031201]